MNSSQSYPHSEGSKNTKIKKKHTHTPLSKLLSHSLGYKIDEKTFQQSTMVLWHSFNPFSHKLSSQKYDSFAINLFITIINNYKSEKY